MIDNRTTELREKLAERGVEFTTDDFDHLLTTNWWVDEIYAKYLEDTSESYVDEDDPILKLRIKRVTPEQAIAATMGSEREKRLEKLVNQLWYLVNHRSGYGYAAALEAIEELGIEVNE